MINNAGLFIYDDPFRTLSFSYQLSPFYSINQRRIKGAAQINYQFTNRSGSTRISIRPTISAYAGFRKLGVSGSLFLKHQNPLISEQMNFSFFNYTVDQSLLPQYPNHYSFGTLRYTFDQSNIIVKRSINGQVETDFSSFVKLGLEPKFEFQYLRNTYFNMRGFAGLMFSRSNTPEAFHFHLSGSTDYAFREVFLDRAQQSEVVQGFSRQSDLNEGGFKGYSGHRTANWIATLNISLEVPKVSFIGLFADVGYLPSDLQYGWGVQFRLVKEIFDISVPLGGVSYSSAILGESSEYFNNIRFALKLNVANPFYQIDRRLGLRY